MLKNILKKLSSRKFWVALIGFVSTLGIALGVNSLTMEQVCAVIGACGTLCAYIFAEGYIDSKSDISADKSEKDENK